MQGNAPSQRSQKNTLNLIIEGALREKKYFKVYQEFTANPRAESVTPKFYARHETQGKTAPQEYIELCKRYVSSVPRDRVSYPETENQWYGWNTTLLCDVRHNKRLNFPAPTTPDIKLAAEMKKFLHKEKPFLGVPFKL
uniref:Uncharacterized protein n=1 Tax=Triatoma infestans TaxID=30076 RepID=A0A161M4A6_TRIIF